MPFSDKEKERAYNREYMRKIRRENPSYFKEKDRKWQQSEKGKASIVEAKNRYRQTIKGKEKELEYRKWYSSTHRETINKKAREKARVNHLKSYGLTIGSYEDLIKQQNNRCLICNKEFTPNNKAYIDHCHKTGNFRGLLHNKCNGLLGLADDSIEILSGAIEYQMPHYDFNLDLPISKATDKQIAAYLCANEGMKYISTCNTNAYDLLMTDNTGKNITIEIKEDFTCEKTGNIGVEYSCRGKPSGIDVSRADFYYYKIHEPNGKISLYRIVTSELKTMIQKQLFFRTVNGGDPGSDSLNYLFKLHTVKQHFSFVCYLP